MIDHQPYRGDIEEQLIQLIESEGAKLLPDMQETINERRLYFFDSWDLAIDDLEDIERKVSLYLEDQGYHEISHKLSDIFAVDKYWCSDEDPNTSIYLNGANSKLVDVASYFTFGVLRRIPEAGKTRRLKESKPVDEAKQVGTLYHYTSIWGLLGILRTNEMGDDSKNSSVSFTRDKNFHKSIRDLGGLTQLRLVIDGDKLSEKYKLEPFNYYNIPYVPYKLQGRTHQRNYEAEERIVGRVIHNIRSYIKGVEFLSYALQSENDRRKTSSRLKDWEDIVIPPERLTIEKIMDIVRVDYGIQSTIIQANVATESKQLDEAKQVGKLYHYTSVAALLGILELNELRAANYDKVKFISFTRDKNFEKTKGRTIKSTDVRITLDGNKLSERYKLEPFNYFNKATRQQDLEAEERYVGKKITDIRNYITHIEFLNRTLEPAFESEFEEILRHLSTPSLTYELKQSLIDQYEADGLLDNKLIATYVTDRFEIPCKVRSGGRETKLIKEGKQVGTLYHYTSIVRLLRILDEWELKPHHNFAEPGDEETISFTRDKNFHRSPRSVNSTQVRLVLDGDKMADRYKFEPYDYFGKRPEVSIMPKGLKQVDSEAEERVHGRAITKLGKYLKSVDILSSALDDPRTLEKTEQLIGYDKDDRLTIEKFRELLMKEYPINCTIIPDPSAKKRESSVTSRMRRMLAPS